MTTFVGAAPDLLDRLASAFDAGADRVQHVVDDLCGLTATIAWRGADADLILARLTTDVSPTVVAAIEVLRAAAAVLRAQAADQRRASGGGGTPARGGSGPPRPLDQPASRADANHARIERDAAAARASDPGQTLARTRVLAFLLGQQVLVYDPVLGRVATVEGDLSTAAHVAVVVPGMGSTFDGFPGGPAGTWDKSHAVFDAAQRSAPGDVAVIAWLGYDAPPSVPAASRGDRAGAGGLLLTEFVRGLGLTATQHLTLVGHSYGSTVIGYGVLDGTPAHDVVVLGSPGLGVEHEADLRLPAGGHVYAERAPQDPVGDLEAFGNDPSMPSFGGVRVATNGAGFPEVAGHARYFTPGSVAMDDVGLVVTGRRPVAQPPSPGDVVADLTDVPAVAEQALHRAAVAYHGPGDVLVRGADRTDRVVHGGIEAIERNVIDEGVGAIGAAVASGGALVGAVGDLLGGLG